MRLNPVLAREIRQRMRGGRVVGVLTLFLLLVAAITAIAYGASSSTSGSFANGERMFASGLLDGIVLPSDVARIGQQIFAATTFTMFLLMALMLPVIASSAISGERERQTLVPLQVTPMRPLQIMNGKFGASILFVLLLIVVALPLLALSYTVGGVSVSQIVKAAYGLFLAAAVFTAVGLFSSSLARRSLTSVMLALILTFGLVLGTWVAGMVLADMQVAGERHPMASRYPLLINPLALVADLSASQDPEPGVVSPWDGVKSKFTSARAEVLVPESLKGDAQNFDVVGPGGVLVGADVGQGAQVAIAPKDQWNWQLRSIVVQTVLVIVVLLLCARRIRTPARSER